jgi:ribonuclease HI
MKKEKIINSPIMVYTDGACSNNPKGPGGWAATLNRKDGYTIISGYEKETTNNRMELRAIVEAIRRLVKEGYRYIIINSDSAYVVNAINKNWICNWWHDGWKTKQGEDVANLDLWQQIFEMMYEPPGLYDLKVEFRKVVGHSGNTFNEIADEEAKAQVKNAKMARECKIR